MSRNSRIYFVLAIAACLNLLTYPFWEWVGVENPSVVQLTVPQLIYNFAAGYCIIKKMLEKESE